MTTTVTWHQVVMEQAQKRDEALRRAAEDRTRVCERERTTALERVDTAQGPRPAKIAQETADRWEESRLIWLSRLASVEKRIAQRALVIGVLVESAEEEG